MNGAEATQRPAPCILCGSELDIIPNEWLPGEWLATCPGCCDYDTPQGSGRSPVEAAEHWNEQTEERI